MKKSNREPFIGYLKYETIKLLIIYQHLVYFYFLFSDLEVANVYISCICVVDTTLY